MNVYAQGVGDVIGTINPGPFGELNFSGILSWGVSLFFFGMGMIALIMLLQGALNWVTSGGEEKKLGEFNLANLHSSSVSCIMSAESQSQTLLRQGLELKNLEKRKLLQGLFAAVFAQGNTLTAIRFTEVMYPLVKLVLPREESSFYNGSDGCDRIF